MPKLKTHKGIAKRIKKTSQGKLKRRKAFHSHLLTKKSGNKKRDLRKSALIDKAYESKYKQLIPYE
ncbi:MAG: large subunit ribosomal protein [Halanaerobiales bacterium]|nr:large subunit ribosomal protein [Halanaerobiales bacterium]